MGAIFRRGTITTAASTTAVVPSLALPIPAATQVGDYLVAQICGGASVAISVTTPAGWATLPGFTPQAQATATASQWLFVRVADGTEGASVTFTISSPRNMSGTMGAYANVSRQLPIQVVDQTTAVGSTTVTYPTSNPIANNAYPIAFTTCRNASTAPSVSVASSGYTATSIAAGLGISASIVQDEAPPTSPPTTVTPGNMTLNVSCTQNNATVLLNPVNSGFLMFM